MIGAVNQRQISIPVPARGVTLGLYPLQESSYFDPRPRAGATAFGTLLLPGEIGDLSRGAQDLVRALASCESDELTGSGKK